MSLENCCSASSFETIFNLLFAGIYQRSATPGGCTAGVTLQAGAVADQGEVAAFVAIVAFVALHAGGADAFEAEIAFGHWREGEGAVGVERDAAGAAVEHGQFVAQ